MDISIQIGGLTGPLKAPRIGFFPAQAYDWDGIEAPLSTATATGTSSGVPRHKPIRVTRAEDPATQPMAQAFINNAVVGGAGGVTVAADYLNAAGVTQSATFALTNARIVRLAFSAHAGGADDVTEEVSFVYQQITITQQPSGANAVATFA